MQLRIILILKIYLHLLLLQNYYLFVKETTDRIFLITCITMYEIQFSRWMKKEEKKEKNKSNVNEAYLINN